MDTLHLFSIPLLDFSMILESLRNKFKVTIKKNNSYFEKYKKLIEVVLPTLVFRTTHPCLNELYSELELHTNPHDFWSALL